jgi:chemotaxis signal transduction protein
VVVAGAHVDAAVDLVGLVVDGVHQVLDLRDDEVDPTVAFGTSARPRLVQATARAGDRFVLLLDLPQVLAQIDLDDLELPIEPQEATP